MFCDRCDRGYHTFCVGLKAIPTGRWKCTSCKEIEPALQATGIPPASPLSTPIKAKYARIIQSSLLSSNFFKILYHQ